MDQNKTNIPHLRHVTKSTQNLRRLRTHLTGVLVHTKAPEGKIVYGFYDILQFSHDCNLTITYSLVKVLANLCCSENPLPRVLYLLSGKQKHKYILSFCTLLVQQKYLKRYVHVKLYTHVLTMTSIFTQVKVNFLPVGYTHEDVDQFFSKVSTYLNRVGAESLPGFTSYLHVHSYT